MKCPRCGFENQEGKSKCSMCHYEFVNKNPVPNTTTTNNTTMTSINIVNNQEVDRTKLAKMLKGDFIFLFIFSLLVCGFIFFMSGYTITLRLIVQVSYTVLLFIGIILAGKKSPSAGYLGLFIGIIMALTIIDKDIIDCLLGVFLISHSLKYNK